MIHGKCLGKGGPGERSRGLGLGRPKWAWDQRVLGPEQASSLRWGRRPGGGGSLGLKGCLLGLAPGRSLGHGTESQNETNSPSRPSRLGPGPLTPCLPGPNSWVSLAGVRPRVAGQGWGDLHGHVGPSGPQAGSPVAPRGLEWLEQPGPVRAHGVTDPRCPARQGLRQRELRTRLSQRQGCFPARVLSSRSPSKSPVSQAKTQLPLQGDRKRGWGWGQAAGAGSAFLGTQHQNSPLWVSVSQGEVCVTKETLTRAGPKLTSVWLLPASLPPLPPLESTHQPPALGSAPL